MSLEDLGNIGELVGVATRRLECGVCKRPRKHC